MSQYEKTVMDAIKKLEEKLDEEEEVENPAVKVAKEKQGWKSWAQKKFSNFVWRICFIEFFSKYVRWIGEFPISFQHWLAFFYLNVP